MINTIKKLLGANFLSQIIGLIIYPILMLTYSIEDLSVYGMLYGGMSILSILLTLRLENLFFSLSPRKSQTIFIHYVKNVFSVIFLVLILSFFLLFVLEDFYLKVVIYTLSGGLFLGIFNISYNFLVRVKNEKYNLMKVVRAFFELGFVGLSIILSLDIFELFLLIALSYFLVSIPTLLYCIKYRGKKNKEVGVLRFVVVDSFSSFLNVAYLYSPNYFLYFGHNKSLSGYYFIISRIFGVPSIMVAQSLSTVLKQYLSGKKENVYRSNLIDFNEGVFSKTFKVYCFISFIFLLFFMGLDYFKYNGIVYVFLVVFPLMIFRFKFVVYSGLLYVLRDYKGNLMLQVLLFSIGLLSFILGWFFDNSWISMLFYCFLSLIVYRYFVKLILLRNPD